MAGLMDTSWLASILQSCPDYLTRTAFVMLVGKAVKAVMCMEGELQRVVKETKSEDEDPTPPSPK